MGAASDDLARIAGDGRLSEATRRRRLGERRGSAAFDAVSAGGFPAKFSAAGYRVEIGGAELDGLVLRLTGVKAWRGNRRVPVDDTLQWVNPPLLVADPAGDVVLVTEDGPVLHREDPGAVIVRDILRIVTEADR